MPISDQDQAEFDQLAEALNDLAQRAGAKSMMMALVLPDETVSQAGGCACEHCFGALVRALALASVAPEEGGCYAPDRAGSVH
jgi:hypothetical protein